MYLSIDQVSNVAVLNVALLVTDSFRLGFERPWNRYHLALADLRNPNCSGQEHKEMGKTVRLDTGRRQSHWSMGNNNSAERPVSACSGFSTPSRGIRPNGSTLVGRLFALPSVFLLTLSGVS
jgi:hypothetical protein